MWVGWKRTRDDVVTSRRYPTSIHFSDVFYDFRMHHFSSFDAVGGCRRMRNGRAFRETCHSPMSPPVVWGTFRDGGHGSSNWVEGPHKPNKVFCSYRREGLHANKRVSCEVVSSSNPLIEGLLVKLVGAGSQYLSACPRFSVSACSRSSVAMDVHAMTWR